MYAKGIILSLGLLSLIAGGRSVPRSAFSIPSLLKSGEQGSVCLDVKNHKEPVHVSMFLEVKDVNHTVYNQPVQVDELFKCVEFQVPVLPSAAPVFLIVSATATDYDYTERRFVVVAPAGHHTFIQFDKYIYKAGQKVRGYLISMDNNLKPVDQNYSLMYITDPSNNRLYQWRNMETKDGFLLFDFDLLDDPEFGTYQAHAETPSKDQYSQTFEVDDYALPKIDVKLSVPKTITILDETLPFTYSAFYTHGQRVPGKVSGRVNRPPINYYRGNTCNRNPDGLYVTVTGELDSNGIFSGTVDLTTFQLSRSGYDMELKVQMTLTEEGSGIQVTETKSVRITNQMGRVTFNRENMHLDYRKGIPCYLEATVLDGLEKPVSDQIIELLFNGVPIKNLTSDADGKVRDYIDTTGLEQPTINIQVNYRISEECYDSTYVVPVYSNDFYTYTRFYSPSGSFVQLEGPKEEPQCGQTYNITAKYIFNELGLREDEEKIVDFSFMIMSQIKINSFGTFRADLTKSMKGDFTFQVAITADHAPVSDVAVYSMLDNEVVAHTLRLKPENCFSNKVSMKFSEESGKPGSPVDLNIESAPKSMCLFRVYDSSLLLLKQDQSLTPQKVYSALHYTSLNGYYSAGYNVAPPRPKCTDETQQKMFNGLYYAAIAYPEEGDSFKELSNMGMHFITNVSMSQPTLCGQPFFDGRPPIFASLGGSGGFGGFGGDLAFARDPGLMSNSFESSFGGAGAAGAPASPAPEESLRNYFPELWQFIMAQTSEDGLLSLPMEVPGTLTGWKGDAVCLGAEKGFGMTKYPANFTSFQEFFVSPSLPNSCVRKEILIVRVVASFYLNDKCGKVTVAIAPSNDYTIQPMEGNGVQCICSGNRATFPFIMVAKSVGVLSLSITGEATEIGDECDGSADPKEPKRIDTIVTSIIVESEGISQEETKSTLICVNDESVDIEVNIVPPENAIENATTAKVTAIGNILGNALSKPESIFKEPTGDGIQNVASLMAMASVTDFLNKTGRLTEEKRVRAVVFLEIGYRRVVRNRRPDGSFSIFPNGESNPWLTLQTLECMHLIKKYIEVEDRITNQILVWLETLRDKTTGAFRPKEDMPNNALKVGEEDNDISFSSMMAATLLQTEYASSPTLVRDVLNFLNGASQKEQSVSTTAVMFLAFRMAGNEKKSAEMLEKLKKLQIEGEGTMHWELPNPLSQPGSRVFPSHADSAAVQTTSIILQGLTIGGPPLSPEELTYWSQIALWISQQQNPEGSYSTPLDSVAAIKALCAYGPYVDQKDASNAVDVKYEDEVVKTFNLNPENRDLLHTHALPTATGNYKISVSGKGCVMVQTTVKYNIPVKDEDSAFSVSVYTPPESCKDGVAYTIPVHMNVSYNGPRNDTNMVLVEFVLPSGYTMEYQSLKELQTKVDKVLQRNNSVYMYLKKIIKGITFSIKLLLQMGARTQSSQTKYVRVSDCYKKEENGLASFHHPCFTQLPV